MVKFQINIAVPTLFILVDLLVVLALTHVGLALNIDWLSFKIFPNLLLVS